MKLLTVPEASKYLKISTHTLNRWRSKKKGPEFMKNKMQIVYRKESLDAFLSKSKA
jgi:hypothetical protein